MAIASDEAQYFPRRYSSTKTGTLAPTFTFRTRSLRTTLPGKASATLLSSKSIASCSLIFLPCYLHRNRRCVLESPVSPHLDNKDPQLRCILVLDLNTDWDWLASHLAGI